MARFMILTGNGQLELDEYFFEHANAVRCRSAFKLLFKEPGRNEATIVRLGEYLAEKVAGAEDRLRQIRLKTARCVRIVPEFEKEEKKARRSIERYKKMLQVFEEMKAKI